MDEMRKELSKLKEELIDGTFLPFLEWNSILRNEL